MRYYVLIEWNGEGSGEITATSNDKKYLLSLRQKFYSANEALTCYNNYNYFFTKDVACSEIVTYNSINDYKKGKKYLNSENWY
jgi:hypothetical protein